MSLLANVRPSQVMAFVERLEPGRWAVQAHAGNGIVRGHLRGPFDQDELATELDGLRARAVEAGGNLILSRCPTDAKERLKVWGEPRGDWTLMEQIKRALDPDWVMNPGRFVGTI